MRKREKALHGNMGILPMAYSLGGGWVLVGENLIGGQLTYSLVNLCALGTEKRRGSRATKTDV